MPLIRSLLDLFDENDKQQLCRDLEEKAFIRDAITLITRPNLDAASRKSGVSINVLEAWQKRVVQKYAKVQLDSLDKCLASFPETLISTSFSGLDETLGGGLKGGSATMISGCENVGKTQFCHTLAARVSFEQKYVLYIDTQCSFSAERLVTMMKKSRPNQNPRRFLPFINVLKVLDPSHLFDILYSIAVDDEGQKYSLLIIDSILDVFSGHFSRIDEGNPAEKFMMLDELSRSIATLRLKRPGLAIVLTKSHLPWFTRHWERSCSHLMEIRFRFEKKEEKTKFSPEREVVIVKGVNLSKSSRTTFLVVITDEGVIDQQ